MNAENAAEEDVSRKETSLKLFDKLVLNLAENDAEEEILTEACYSKPNPVIAKKVFPDRKTQRKMIARHLVLRRE